MSNEGYPANWKHCTIHLDESTGEMHSDGDHSVREWIEKRTATNAELLEACRDAAERMDRAREILRERGNWGMLDTTRQLSVIAKSEGQA